MKKFIILTSRDGSKIFVDPNMIGHLYSDKETGQYLHEEKGRCVTIVGCLTHNNGGFRVLETVDDIIKMIEKFNMIEKINLVVSK